MCVAESLHCSPETIRPWLISYTPGQNKKFKKIKTVSHSHNDSKVKKKKNTTYYMKLYWNELSNYLSDGLKTKGT